jgi:hypothetical protein
MSNEIKAADQSGVDKGLIAMFLRMSPEERLLANDNAFHGTRSSPGLHSGTACQVQHR